MISERDSIMSVWSDCYKDVHGVRPRWDVSGMTYEDFAAEIDVLQAELELVIQREREQEARAIAEFEQSVAVVIESGASDRETALRWLMDASEADGDWKYFCYLNGLPYEYFDEINV
jgi:hypothetical protein